MVEVTLAGEAFSSGKRSERTLHWVVTSIAGVVILYSLLLFSGFEFTFIQTPTATTYTPSAVTAGLLMLGGIAAVAVSQARRTIGLVCGLIVLVLGSVAVVDSFLHSAQSALALNAGVTFVLLGISTCLVATVPGTRGSYVAGVASMIVFLSGAVAFIKVTGGTPPLFSWAATRPMSPETSMGFILMGFAISGMGFARNREAGGESIPAWFPYTASLSAFGVTLAIWWGMRSAPELIDSPYSDSVLTVGTIACLLLAVSLHLWRRFEERALAAVRVNGELQNAQRRLEYILDGTNVGTWEWNVPSGTLLVNQRWESMLGFDVTLTGVHRIETWFAGIHRSDLTKMNDQLREHFEGVLPLLDLEIRFKRPDGEWLWMHLRGKVATWTSDKRPELASGTLLDVTRRKRAELSNAASLKEKESLLRELQHRTKNNLNMIAGLLSLQSIQSQDPVLKKALTAVKSRIGAMGLLYAQLQEADELGTVDLGEYLTRLTTALVASLGGDGVEARIDIDPNLPGVTHSQAVYVGILVNEVVTNSLKYAFPDDAGGRICVSLSRVAPSRLELVVEDNGVGFVPDDNDAADANSTSMGLELSRMLAEEQLKGSYHCESGNGVRHVMEFELERQASTSLP
ncbi:MAG: histidine kinase dimerization/phosphoacceptor domain -containing protein [Spirochaetota bacterium]